MFCRVAPLGHAATLRWSSAATWRTFDYNPSDNSTAAPSFIPGVGAGAGVNVTIPCGVAVLLDVPNLALHTLTVEGFLQCVLRPNQPESHIALQARVLLCKCIIVMTGMFTVGKVVVCNAHCGEKHASWAVQSGGCVVVCVQHE